MSFFKSIGKALDSAGREVSRGVDSASKSVNKTFDEHWSSAVLDMFKSGNVVQLVSRSSGKTFQIVQSPTGQLVVDGLGPEGPNFYHAHWTCLNEGKNIVRLYNQQNYLCIVNGCTQLISCPDPAMAGIETRLRLRQTGNFIMLESVKEQGKHVAVLPTGELKSALAAGTEIDSQFGVRLILNANPEPVEKKKAGEKVASEPEKEVKAEKVQTEKVQAEKVQAEKVEAEKVSTEGAVAAPVGVTTPHAYPPQVIPTEEKKV